MPLVISNYQFSLNPFREPRGFIKILQVFFAIIAFSTTVGFSTDFGFKVRCINNTTMTIKATMEYPFAVDKIPEQVIPSDCAPGNVHVHFNGNARSDAQYFVCTGVLSLLYALIASVFYSACDKAFQENPRIPLADFGVSLVLAIFWISAVAAWGKGTSMLQEVSDGNKLYKDNKMGDPNFPAFGGTEFYPSFSKLVVSILFGVINFVLWTGNLWFLWKETTWFENIVRNSVVSRQNTGGV